MTPDEDRLDLIEDEGEHRPQPALAGKPWKILIVDDEPEVHNATVFALQDVRIDGRALRFLHAHSAAQARALIESHPDLAVMLLDVVMEGEHAGLDLVRLVREELRRTELRIILRTGQPGYAPEMRVIRDYDINDYKTKAELTRVRLVTSLTTAVRSYEQLCAILASRRGLALIVGAAADLYSRRALTEFAHGVLTQIAGLLGLAPEGILCAGIAAESPDADSDPLRVIGAAGRFSSLIDQPLDAIGDPAIVAAIRRCLAEGRSRFGNDGTVLHLCGSGRRPAAVYLATRETPSEADRQLLDVFCVNIAVGLENVGLFNDLRQSAFRDRLTGLLNRTGFIAEVDRRLGEGVSGWTLALVDIDHFSEINDALGHQQGDELLVSVARRLGGLGESPRLLGRVAGDVFALFAPDAELAPQRVLDLFARPIELDEYALPIRATLGLTRQADVDGDGLTLLKTVNIALNRAKHDQRGRWHYYTREMTDATRERLDLLHRLRSAMVENSGIELHYQPQLDLASGRVVGVEALIRWHEGGTYIPPDRFISLAEYSGLIIDLGSWVTRTAISQLRDWHAGGLNQLRMAINVSPAQFRDPEFVTQLAATVAASGLPPGFIELEITENLAFFDADWVIDALHRVRALGVQVAIDDFGTGYSSLSYLHRLPVTRLKIDRAFIRRLGAGHDTGVPIAQTVIQLGKTLGLSTLAEGVETPAQEALLREMGCELTQGFLYSAALPARAFEEWLARRN